MLHDVQRHSARRKVLVGHSPFLPRTCEEETFILNNRIARRSHRRNDDLERLYIIVAMRTERMLHILSGGEKLSYPDP
jgi:hypothetical protein